jgi:hypothetical protein
VVKARGTKAHEISPETLRADREAAVIRPTESPFDHPAESVGREIRPASAAV